MIQNWGGGGGATRYFRRPDGPTLMVESGGRNQMIQNGVLGGASRCYSIGGFRMFQEIRWPGPIVQNGWSVPDVGEHPDVLEIRMVQPDDSVMEAQLDDSQLRG